MIKFALETYKEKVFEGFLNTKICNGLMISSMKLDRVIS